MILQSNAPLQKNANAATPANQFQADIITGLGSIPKKLQSKYFYDKTGDALFQQIMAMPDYYLTRCELDIFKNSTADLASVITAPGKAFDLIELGAGDATKSSYLLKYLLNHEADFTYMPIDISGNILNVLDAKLKAEIPQLNITCLEGDYFTMLDKAAKISERRKVVLFLGGNIGNMEKEEALSFCRELRAYLNPGDIVLIGFDLKKHPQTILNAYNDKEGVTAAFNLNLLTRINRELKADFDVNRFEHYQNYDPLTGACRSYLVSLADQEVCIDKAHIHFDKDEAIYMEVSQKFSAGDIQKLAHNSGFTVADSVTDSKGWFTDSLWIAK
jgi:L-histidine N-alpha-methyltransferase